jgi:hypothetical protein
VLELFLEQVGSDRAQVDAQQLAQSPPLAASQVAGALEEQPSRLGEQGRAAPREGSVGARIGSAGYGGRGDAGRRRRVAPRDQANGRATMVSMRRAPGVFSKDSLLAT